MCPLSASTTRAGRIFGKIIQMVSAVSARNRRIRHRSLTFPSPLAAAHPSWNPSSVRLRCLRSGDPQPGTGYSAETASPISPLGEATMLPSQIGQGRHLRGQNSTQVEAPSALSVAVRWGASGLL